MLSSVYLSFVPHKGILKSQRVCEFLSKIIRIGLAGEMVSYFGDGLGGEDS